MFDDHDSMPEDFEDFISIRRELPSGTWQTANGEVLQIKNMESSHIVNCINILKRRGNASAKIAEFQAELASRGTFEHIKHEVRVNLDEILDLVVQHYGVKLPASGGGFYIGDKRIKEVVLKWDTSKTLDLNGRKRGSQASRKMTGHKASGRRGSKRNTKH